MPSVEPVDDSLAPDSENEVRAKKGISILDAVLLALGFTSSNLQHIITPIAQGGLGASLSGLGGAIAGTIILGVSTLIITGIVSYFLFKLINKNSEENLLLIEKEKEWKERQIVFFARLVYLRHLLKMSENPHLPYFHRTLRKHLDLDSNTATELAVGVDSIYREEKGFTRVFLERDKRIVSEEKAIQEFLSENAEKYMPRIQHSLHYMDIVHPAQKKNWKPELVGAFAGFISFISMSSGFLGAYSSMVTLAMSISTVSLAVPILGWAIFGCSLLFALGIGLAVRRYTDKTIKRQEVMNDIEKQQSKLADGLGNLHELEMRLLTTRLDQAEKMDAKELPQKRMLTRSRSWSGKFFTRPVMIEEEVELKMGSVVMPLR